MSNLSPKNVPGTLCPTIEFFEDPGKKLNDIFGEDEVGEEEEPCPN